jgi:hypothetical protein
MMSQRDVQRNPGAEDILTQRTTLTVGATATPEGFWKKKRTTEVRLKIIKMKSVGCLVRALREDRSPRVTAQTAIVANDSVCCE